MTVRASCDCCKRRRSIWSLVPVETDFGLLVVCGDRAGCKNLDMPLRAIPKARAAQ